MEIWNFYQVLNYQKIHGGKQRKQCEEKERKFHELHLDIKDVQIEYALLKAENMKIEKEREVEKIVVPKVKLDTSVNTNREEGDTSE